MAAVEATFPVDVTPRPTTSPSACVRSLAFELPDRLEAHAPAEERDAVRMLVALARDESIEHEPFRSVVDVLEPGDLLVVNVSRTPRRSLSGSASLSPPLDVAVARRPGLPLGGRAAPRLEPVRRKPHRRRARAACRGARTAARAVSRRPPSLGRRPRPPEPLFDYLARYGSPIRYRYVGERPLSDYQTVFASEPGSAEMPSAAAPRPGS